jgi:hypothetical protein
MCTFTLLCKAMNIVKRYTCKIFFGLKWFAKRTHVGLFFDSNLPSYSTFHAFCVFLVNVPIRCAYSQYMNRFIPHIHSIGTDSYNVFCEYAQPNSVWRFTSFRVFSEYVQIHSAYYQYIHTDPSRAFSVYEQIHSAYSANGANNFKYSEIELFSSQLIRNTS